MANVWIVVFLVAASALVHKGNAQNVISFGNELQDYLSPKLDKSKFTLASAKDLLEKKCQKVSVNGTHGPQYENFEKAAYKFFDCVSDIANVTEVLEEAEQARPTGDLDLVIIKYCKRLPEAKRCLEDFNGQFLVCLTPNERIENSNMLRIFFSLLDALCDKNGDAISLFIAEEGPECLDAHRDDIMDCMNSTFSGYFPNDMPEDLPELIVGSKECIDFYDFEKCVIKYLDTCKEVTPSGIVESVFRYLRRETICQAEIDKAQSKHQRNAASIQSMVSWSMLAISTILLLVLNEFV
ncbi:27 kDa hemolymph protein-like [Haematobia irritans]|uniref:27 kDa hemolymph protein-like n=1 Tax=Haematobia irritans TaxID=7368 RepID=UPI003F50842E